MGSENDYQMNVVKGEFGYVLEDVPHFADYIPDLPVYFSLHQMSCIYNVCVCARARADMRVFVTFFICISVIGMHAFDSFEVWRTLFLRVSSVILVVPLISCDSEINFWNLVE